MKKLAEYTTFRMGGVPSLFKKIHTLQDVEVLEALSEKSSLPLTILGGGSNIIFDSNPINRLVAEMNIVGSEIVEENDRHTYITVGAGTQWDEIVLHSIQQGLSGIEALSGIPGTVGATPIQNVGAYGVEIKDVLESVTVFDRKDSQWKKLANKECCLSYRWSIFKENPDRYIITSIILKLSRKTPSLPSYKKLQDLFRKTDTPLTSHALRLAVLRLRSLSLPDPQIFPNAGSFFKNPIISKEKEEELRKKFPSLVSFPLENGMYKLAAGWLIDQCGLKGFKKGHFSTYSKNALIIIHDGEGSYSELHSFISKIISAVEEKFKATLDPEPVFI